MALVKYDAVLISYGYSVVNGLSTQFLKADGSLDNSVYLTSLDLKLNSQTNDGLVLKGSGNSDKVWKTDALGNPAWRDDNSVPSFGATIKHVQSTPSDTWICNHNTGEFYPNFVIFDENNELTRAYISKPIDDMTVEITWTSPRTGVASFVVGGTSTPSPYTAYTNIANDFTEQQTVNGVLLVTDAPTDGNQYARINGGWAVVVGGVESVFGRTGIVIADANDYSAFYLGLTDTASNSNLLENENGAYYLDYNNFTNTPTIPTVEVQSVFGRTGDVIAETGDYNKAQIGLSNVDNTSDLDKPISIATQNALNLKQNLITVSVTPPTNPNIGDLWVDIN